MIHKVSLSNFKSHKNSEISLSNLTVLCGANGVGKSSIIQILLLLRESFLKHSDFEYLDLRSNPVTIGTAEEAIYQFSDKHEISISLDTDVMNLSFSFATQKGGDFKKTLIYKTPSIEHFSDKKELSKESLFNKNCQFISAARLGPQLIYQKDDVVIDIYNQISVINGQAEHFVHFMQKYRGEVLPQLRHKSCRFKTLLEQVSAWEQEISEGVSVVVKDLGNAGYELFYQFNTTTTFGKTDAYKATNVGFGLTYVMPILVAILSAQPGALLFIENPEAHLHPKGQAKLTELICLAAQAGIQIIIETHSDHIINGILVQCKKTAIERENVSIYHFDRDEAKHCSSAKRIEIEDDGRVRYTPKGFFDQFTIDRKFLMGF